MSEALLTLAQVAYGYPGSDWQLRDIDLSLAAGDCLGIVGPNGSGKSTLLKLAAGLLVSARGAVCLQGRPLADLSRRDIARQLGYLPQAVSPSYDHTVADVVGMGRFCRQRGLGFSGAEDQGVIDRCLHQTETIALAARKFSQLSGGERQRVLLASVLAQEPEVLLLDEPTTGLDLHHQVAFFNLLSRFAKDGMATAVVTHDWNLAAQFCDKLLLLKEGRAIGCGPVADVVKPSMLSDLYGSEVLVSTH
ncbi:ABC transporter ATP-binding protein, partial [Planctomycetota bacterium]